MILLWQTSPWKDVGQHKCLILSMNFCLFKVNFILKMLLFFTKFRLLLEKFVIITKSSFAERFVLVKPFNKSEATWWNFLTGTHHAQLFIKNILPTCVQTNTHTHKLVTLNSFLHLRWEIGLRSQWFAPRNRRLIRPSRRVCPFLRQKWRAADLSTLWRLNLTLRLSGFILEVSCEKNSSLCQEFSTLQWFTVICGFSLNVGLKSPTLICWTSPSATGSCRD